MKNCTKSMMDGTQKETGFVHRAISFLLMQAQYAVPSLRALMTALLLIMGSAAFATIEIAGTLGPCGNDMGGMIAVTASGNAGPFTIRLIDGVSDPVEMVIDGVNETIAYFEGLSFGDYTVEVENAYMCVTTLETEVPNNGEQILQDMGTDVSCKCPDGYGFITANISGNITLYEWTGPNQFTYSSALPLLDLLYETGSYNLRVM